MGHYLSEMESEEEYRARTGLGGGQVKPMKSVRPPVGEKKDERKDRRGGSGAHPGLLKSECRRAPATPLRLS